VTTEFAGAIDLEPALTADEIAYVRRLAGSREAAMAWTPTRDGTGLRPRKGADVAASVATLQYLMSTMDRPGRFRGMVAAYDTETGGMVAITASRGRVTRRVLRKRPAGVGERSNVVDLAARRRAVSRAIS